MISWTLDRWAPLYMGFPRQEYWRGLPCPPPGDLPNPGIKPRYPVLQVDSSPAEPPRKSKNTGVGSLFLLQGIFLTQESNWSLCIAGRFFTSWATRELVHYYFLLFCWPKQVTEPNPTSVVPLETYGLGREYFWTMIQSITKGFLCYSSSKYSFYSLPGNFVCYSIV